MDIEAELGRLTARISTLEHNVQDRLAALEARLAQPPPGAPTFLPPEPPAATARLAPPPAGYPAPAPDQMPPPPQPGYPTPGFDPGPRQPIEWDVEAILRWAGAALVALAGIFLVSTAVSRGWVTPEMQLIAAALAGAGLLAATAYLNKTRRPWAVALGLAGALVLVASAVASHAWKDMVDPGPSLVLVALAFAVAAAVAIHTRIDLIAAMAGVVAVWGPVDTYEVLRPEVPALWIVTLLAVTTALGLLNRWPATRLVVGWVAALGVAVSSFDVGDGDLGLGIGIFTLAVAAVSLSAGPNIADRLFEPETASEAERQWRAVDLRTLGVVPGFVWLCILGFATSSGGEGAGYAAMAVAVVFGLIVAAAWTVVSKVASMSMLLGASGLFAIGVAIVFEGPALMVVLAAQAATSVAVGSQLHDRPMRWGGYVLGVAASLVALYEMAVAIADDGFDNPFGGLATLIIVCGWIGAAVWAFLSDEREWFAPIAAIAWIGLMIWLVAVLLYAPEGLSLISAAWAVLAGCGLVVGVMKRIDAARILGLGTLAATLVKLLTIDLAEVDVLVRVVLFFLLGVGLIILGLKIPSLVAPPREAAADDQPTVF